MNVRQTKKIGIRVLLYAYYFMHLQTQPPAFVSEYIFRRFSGIILGVVVKRLQEPVVGCDEVAPVFGTESCINDLHFVGVP